MKQGLAGKSLWTARVSSRSGAPLERSAVIRSGCIRFFAVLPSGTWTKHQRGSVRPES